MEHLKKKAPIGEMELEEGDTGEPLLAEERPKVYTGPESPGAVEFQKEEVIQESGRTGHSETPDLKPLPDETVGHYGHPRFRQMSEEEVELHDRKNHDYAAGGDPLGNFYRVATILALYPGINLSNPAIIPLIFAMKQIDAVLWSHSNGHEAAVEGRQDKLKDISIYVKLSRILEEESTQSEINKMLSDLEYGSPEGFNTDMPK